MICENCNCEHDGSYGSGRFCSCKCARCFSTKAKRKEINEKVSKNSLKRKKLGLYKTDFSIRYCKDCGKKQLCFRNKSGYCSICIKKHVKFSKETREKISKANKGRPRWNIHRNQISYAERFWKKVLENNKIDFTREVAIKKADNQHCYFLDFVIGNIDLEIDGKQHKDADRIISDAKRDEYLTSLGFKVYRIDWNEIKSEKGKLLMKEKIRNFLIFIGLQSE
ncbi:MAG: endonuclease domain-containing protein [Bacteroidales bacterium]|nr:endonuclease domain-containing protein [Bacteroidales bacterium]